MPNMNFTVTDYHYTIVLWLPGGLLVVLCNGLIVTTYFRYGSLRKEAGFTAVALLSMLDLENGICSLINGFMYFIRPMELTAGYCMIRKYFSSNGKCVSELGILFVTLDRLLALRWPLRYFKLNHKRTAAKIYAGIHIYELLILTPVLFLGLNFNRVLDSDNANCPPITALTSRPAQMYYVGFGILAGLAVFVNYRFIVSGLKAHFKSDKDKQQSDKKAEARQKLELKATRSIVVVLVAYIVLCLVPNLLVIVTTILGVETMNSSKFFIVAIGGILNSSMNIVIYSMTNNVFKQHLLGLIRGDSEAEIKKRLMGIISNGNVAPAATTAVVRKAPAKASSAITVKKY